jgi:uncharacterized membrane protein YeiH
MKGYMQQLWNDPAFFTNAIRSLLGALALAATAVIGMPMGRSTTEKVIVGIITAIGGGVLGLPSAKKE